MKKLTILLIVIAGLFTAGCGAGDPEPQATEGGPRNIENSYVETIDGRQVLCIFSSDDPRAGLSCDWDNAK